METIVPDAKDARRARIRALRELFFTLMWMGHRQMVRRLQDYNLTHPQFITLAALVAHSKPVSMRDLTAVTLQDAPSMTRVVDRLAKMDWVRRTRTRQDRRVVLVEATAGGQALVEQIRNDLDGADTLGFSAMTDDELSKLEELVDYVLAIYLRRADQESLGLEDLKRQFQGFANDPIGFIKKKSQSE